MPGLQKVAAALVAPGKGILAADASIATMSRRLEAVGAAPAAAMRRGNRRLPLITQGLAAWISGIILCDETLSQDLPDGTPSGQGAPALGIMADVKVDKGTTPLPFSDGGWSPKGWTGSAADWPADRELGAVFAKWRAVFNITRERLRVRMRGAPVQENRVADNCQRASQASAAGSPDCAQPLSNERQAGRA